MPKRTVNSIATDIRNVFSDTSVPPATTRIRLEELREVIDELLDTLPDDADDDDSDDSYDPVAEQDVP